MFWLQWPARDAGMSHASDPRLRRAAKALAARDFKAAYADCTGVLQEHPANAEALYLLGVIAAEHENRVKARELFDRALAIDPEHAGALAQQARVLLALSKRAEAIESARRAAALEPDDAFVCDTLGVVMSRAGLHEEALPFYEAAVQRGPARAAFHTNLGTAREFAGDLNGARAAFRRAIALDSGETRALVSLVQMTRQTKDENHLPALTSLFEARQQDAADAQRLGHALAKTYEDLGDPAMAMHWLERAKAGRRAAISHDPAADQKLFDAAMEMAARLPVAEQTPAQGPIFIVGMPRTGTTLVERILSSHSAVATAGEAPDFSRALKDAARTPSQFVLDPETLRAAGEIELEALGADYLQRMKATLGLEGRFTDKMPLNALLTPVILAALPGARVICLRRHPADTVLSNYKQMFATQFSYYDYALRLDWTAHYVAGFDQMIRHFAERLPAARFTQVHYEQVVTGLEGETRRLLDFCGLPFEAACLAFHENTAPVATASSTQVREPVHARSPGRWKAWREGLAPALSILQAAGLLEEA
jgi:Tfp pilus assembly protein PilF